jgi:hypothetical protein
MHGQCYHVIRMQLRHPQSTQSDFQKDTILDHVSYKKIKFLFFIIIINLVLSRPKYFGRQCDINDIQL